MDVRRGVVVCTLLLWTSSAGAIVRHSVPSSAHDPCLEQYERVGSQCVHDGVADESACRFITIFGQVICASPLPWISGYSFELVPATVDENIVGVSITEESGSPLWNIPLYHGATDETLRDIVNQFVAYLRLQSPGMRSTLEANRARHK